MRNRSMRVRASAIALAAAAAAAGAAVNAADAGGRLNVTVTGIKTAQGKLIACLWTDKTGFPSCSKSRTARRLVVPVTGTTMRLSFPDVRPGQYAVTVEHDENGDGKMGRNFIGMPTEGVGASNNPGGMPGFAKSLVGVDAGTAIEVRMRYLFG